MPTMTAPTAPRRTRASRWVRRTAALCAFSFTWTFVVATPAQLMAAPTPKAHSTARPYAVPASAVKHRRVPPPASLRQNLKPLSPAQLARLKAGRHSAPAASLSLLDEVGRLARRVSDAEVSAWRKQLRTPGLRPAAASKLRLQVGEVELAKYQQPERAIALFEQVEQATSVSSPLHALARVDAAMALFYEGAYQASATAFRSLAQSHERLPGIDRRQCARWLTHARACAGYHAVREKAGIREPKRLDPLCGAEAVAVVLREMNRPFDRKTVLSAVRLTGEGSSMQDLFDGGRKLGLAPHVVTAALPA